MQDIAIINDVVTMSLSRFFQLLDERTEAAAVRAIEKMRTEEQEDAEELLSVVAIAEEFNFNSKTLFARINERHIETFPFPGNRRQRAIRRKHLKDILRKRK